MKKIVLLAVIGLILKAGKLAGQPAWSVNPSDYQYTMTITCVALFDCMESIDTSDMVAAFINGEVRGVQRLDTRIDGRNFAFMIVYDNDFSGNQITFKLYDASANEEHDAIGSIEFLENANIGNVDDPFEVKTDYAIEGL